MSVEVERVYNSDEDASQPPRSSIIDGQTVTKLSIDISNPVRPGQSFDDDYEISFSTSNQKFYRKDEKWEGIGSESFGIGRTIWRLYRCYGYYHITQTRHRTQQVTSSGQVIVTSDYEVSSQIEVIYTSKWKEIQSGYTSISLPFRIDVSNWNQIASTISVGYNTHMGYFLEVNDAGRITSKDQGMISDTEINALVTNAIQSYNDEFVTTPNLEEVIVDWSWIKSLTEYKPGFGNYHDFTLGSLGEESTFIWNFLGAIDRSYGRNQRLTISTKSPEYGASKSRPAYLAISTAYATRVADGYIVPGSRLVCSWMKVDSTKYYRVKFYSSSPMKTKAVSAKLRDIYVIVESSPTKDSFQE